MGDAPIRVLIADDHAVVRRGLRTFLELQDDIDVVGEAADGEACVTAAVELSPDVILLDLLMPGVGGVEALGRLREAGSTARVLVITSFTDPAVSVPAVRAGAAGVIFKDVEPRDLASAIRSVHAGHTLLQPDVAAALMAPDPVAASPLTAREREVLAEIARGRSNREIARVLTLSEKTVKTHVSNVLMKLGVADRTQAALLAVRRGLVDRGS
ncbi:MAG TPA: response regulator transcription factor [Micromonosporaceae bacterium]|nr:response regulator transcription factor [Micromonosporaceae bacterium]